MKQQINLYQPMFHIQPNPLSPQRIQIGFALLVLVMGVVYGFLSYQVSSDRAELARAQTDQKRLAEQIAGLQALAGPKEKSQLLESEVQRLEVEHKRKMPLMEFFSADASRNVKGFSPSLSALARQHLNGLWLQRILLADGGTRLLLEGSALEPGLVPRYLGGLGKDGAFAGLEFSKFVIYRADRQKSQVDFKMETGFPEDEK